MSVVKTTALRLMISGIAKNIMAYLIKRKRRAAGLSFFVKLIKIGG